MGDGCGGMGDQIDGGGPSKSQTSGDNMRSVAVAGREKGGDAVRTSQGI